VATSRLAGRRARSLNARVSISTARCVPVPQRAPRRFAFRACP
jgi:hypothetical protein